MFDHLFIVDKDGEVVVEAFNVDLNVLQKWLLTYSGYTFKITDDKGNILV